MVGSRWCREDACGLLMLFQSRRRAAADALTSMARTRMVRTVLVEVLETQTWKLSGSLPDPEVWYRSLTTLVDS